ncbi:MAG: aldo/keto reductase, partial [Ilumatobacteraceae bacterium]
MPYRRLGATGVKVSVLSFGSWVTFDNQLDTDLALECMQAAHDAGCNFFDNAESYAAGRSEEIMGRALRELGWPRWSYLVTTKLFWGIHGDDPNMRNTLNRKYLSQAIDASLDRFGLDFVDVVYCHRADPDTPLEETVWAMSDMVSQGKALYWGTSEWSADEIRSAMAIADRVVRAIKEDPRGLVIPPEVA